MLLSGFTRPEGEVFTSNVPALLLCYSYLSLGIGHLLRVRLFFNFTLFASCILFLDGSGHRELSLSFDIQLLLALSSSFLCLFLCNECSSVCSTSLS